MVSDRGKIAACLWLGLIGAVAHGQGQGQSAAPARTEAKAPASQDLVQPGEEGSLKNIRQLTFGGTNAEAYFSFEGDRLVFQSTRPPYECDQIFTMGLDGQNQKLVSTGKGKTTCAYFFPGGRRLLYASTHLHDDQCPPPPDRSKGYLWGVYSSFDIFTCNSDGSDLKPLTTEPGYDAEATIAPDGSSIVFTSTRDGDLELYTMDLDGKNVKRLTHEPGYDGGAFFSPDSKKIVYRANHPEGEELKRYKELLAEDLVAPSKVELFIMDRDGSNKRQITHNGAANFGPYFHPSGKKIIFSSNYEDPKGRNFELYLVDPDGKNQKRITHFDGFDMFPVFSPDGKKLVFISSRNGKSSHELNVFIADWIEP
jgi:Tol biopolymer transport system component